MSNKIYYRKSDGYLCDRYPTDISHEGEDIGELEIEDEDIYNNTFCCDYGNTWAVVNGELKEIPCPEIQKTENYRKYEAEKTYVQAKSYLTKTDYLISKINEASIEEDEQEVNRLKTEHADILEKRKEYRNIVRQYEDNR